MDIKLIPESQVSNSDNFINFKIIIIGDSGVGKSSILKRAVKHTFDQNYQATIGFEFLLMHFSVNELKIKLQIWDTCGQEMYRSLVQGFYRNTSLALAVYDISNKKSYEGLDVWFKDLRSHTDQELPIFVAGNKSDLEGERQVDSNEAKEFSKSNRTKYFTECSAKSGQNVEEIFYEAAKYLYNACKELGKNRIPTYNKLKINKKENRNTMKGCCYEDNNNKEKNRNKMKRSINEDNNNEENKNKIEGKCYEDNNNNNEEDEDIIKGSINENNNNNEENKNKIEGKCYEGNNNNEENKIITKGNSNENNNFIILEKNKIHSEITNEYILSK